MTTLKPEPRVIPARLSFLSIYNPSFGETDETVRDQILFYHSRVEKETRVSSKAATDDKPSKAELKEQENERLRQIGLAQGMVNFAKSFSDGVPVDTVETEKSRIVIQQLEEGWWLIASIDLTRLPKASLTPDTTSTKSSKEQTYEYSAREVSPPALLNQQILTAHRIFLLHHGPSLAELFDKVGRGKICDALDRFWSRFCKFWEVLLHGNPAIDSLGGLKLSAGGELGMGVGEEEWGSSERAVLEDLVQDTEGLVDMVVSRFGDVASDVDRTQSVQSDDVLPWIGRGRPAEAADGVVFGGTGQLTRTSLRDISSWIQQIYIHGEYAYGVKDNPARKRRKYRPRAPRQSDTVVAVDIPSRAGSPTDDEIADTQMKGLARTQKQLRTVTCDAPLSPRISGLEVLDSQAQKITDVDQQNRSDHQPGIPPPIVKAAEESLKQAIDDAETQKPLQKQSVAQHGSGFAISDKWMKYLTLGLSTVGKPATNEASTTSLSSTDVRPPLPPRPSTTSIKTIQASRNKLGGISGANYAQPALRHLEPMPEGYMAESQIADQKRLETEGFFLIGYRGHIEREESSQGEEQEDVGERLLLRTIHAEVISKMRFGGEDDSTSESSSVSTYRDGATTEKWERLRVLVYVRRPFIYAFLFEQYTPGLQMSPLYFALHKHLAPLQNSMSISTSGANVAVRLEESREDLVMPDSPGSVKTTKSVRPQPVFDLMFDPIRLTVHSSIPNIPLPGSPAAEGLLLSSISDGQQGTSWTRIEGLNVHSQILNILESTKNASREIERSAKTNRGWWVVWMRMAPSTLSDAATTTAGASGKKSQSSTLYNIQQSQEYETDQCRVAILVRKSSDWTPPKTSMSSRMASGMFGMGKGEDITGGASAGWGPSSLAGGIGFDARRYVEGLLSLNR